MSQNEILSETNYYPFGLQHQGYNELVTSTSLGENWKYQGQERTFDLGLNTDQWKYRVSDPSIGRFWQIDPLGEEYSYQSAYNFAENRVIDGIELEGLEWMSVKDIDGNITGYTWVGYNDDDSAVEGSVGDAAISLDNSVLHLSTDGNKKGTVNILSSNKNGMVEMPSEGTTFTSYNRNDVTDDNGNTIQDGWGTPDNIANFINLAGQYESQFRGDRLEFGDLSTETGGSPRFRSMSTGKLIPHATHYNGSQADLRYISPSGNTLIGKRSHSQSDPNRVQTIVNIANRLGMDHIHLGSSLKNQIIGEGLKFNSGHNNHMHIGKGNGKGN